MPKKQYILHEAHRKLIESGLGPTKLGRLAGASKQLASKWLDGAVPGDAARAAIERELSIRPADWHARPGGNQRPGRRPAGESGAGESVPPVVNEPAPGSPVEHVDRLMAELRRHREKLPPKERSRSYVDEARLVELRERLADVAAERRIRAEAARAVRAAEVVSSPAFAEEIDRLIAVVQAVPGAVEAIHKYQEATNNG